MACVTREAGEAGRLLDEAERWLSGQAFELESAQRELVRLEDGWRWMSRPERMRRVDEAMKQVLSRGDPDAQGPADRVRHRDGSRDVARPRPCEGLGQRVRPRRQREKTLEALAGAVGVLQARINRELKLRRTPHLDFVYDRAVEHGVRMTQLIDELSPADGDDDAAE